MSRPHRLSLIALALLMIAAAATAAAPDLEASYGRLVNGLMSPYCPGRTLASCPSQGAADMRTTIRGWLADGRSEAWITEQLVREWGEDILGAPRFRGLGILAWVAPALLLTLGAVGIGRWLGQVAARRDDEETPTAASAPEPQQGGAAPNDEIVQRVEDEIARLEP